jgi:hypothetical protein
MFMLVLKQAGFLILMAAMGLAAVIAIESGYALAWNVRGEYWLAIPFLVDLALVFLAVALVFRSLRGFLFGRGRPWLAWFSIVCWVGVMGTMTYYEASRRHPVLGAAFAVGNQALSEKVSAAYNEPWSEAELASLPIEERESVCKSVFLEEAGSYAVKRSGIPVMVSLPSDKELAQNVFAGSACPDAMKAQYAELQRLETEYVDGRPKTGVGTNETEFGRKLAQAESFALMAADATLLGHPDSITKMFEIMKTFKDKPVEEKIELARMKLRLMQNGQIKDHQWKPIEGFDFRDGHKAFIDPQIWKKSSDERGDEWHYWTLDKMADGSSTIEMRNVNCRKLDRVDLDFSITTKEGKSKLEPFLDLFGVNDQRYGPNTFAYELNALACASKSQQVKLTDEVANAVPGS